MNNTQKITIVYAVAVVAVVGYLTISKNVTLNKLYERFPDLDKKIAKRTYNNMMAAAISGRMNFDNWSEAQFNDLFFIEYTMMLSNMYQ